MSAFQVLIFHPLLTIVWLLNTPNSCRADCAKYYVRPIDNSGGCNCSVIDPIHSNCKTLNEYATMFSQLGAPYDPFTDKCIDMIFLPGIHTLNRTLVIQQGRTLKMGLYGNLTNESSDSCFYYHNKATIQLQNASIELSDIGNFTLDGIDITVDILDSFAELNICLSLSNVPFHNAHSGDLFLGITGTQLTRCILKYVCHNCIGEVKLSDVFFEESSANFTIKDSSDMTMTMKDVMFALQESQTGLVFDSLELRSLSIDNVSTTDLDLSGAVSDFGTHTDRRNPQSDISFTTDSMCQGDVVITRSSLERRQSTGLMIIMTTQSPECQSSITINDTSISYHEHGGIVIEQTSKSVGKLSLNLIGSRIESNKINVTENYCFAAGLSVHCETANTTSILIDNTQFIMNEDKRAQPVIVYISRVHLLVLENSDFIENSGTAIQVNNVNDECVLEKFIVKGTVNFIGNHGYRGGALLLISTVLSIKPTATLVFEDNKASDVGGAIFVDSNIPYDDEVDPDTLVGCFYKFPVWNRDSDICNITFSNNKADNGGVNIYGAPLKCYCTVHIGKDGSVVRSIDRKVSDLFHFRHPDQPSSVSSNPSRVCIMDTDSDTSFKNACTNSSRIFEYEVKIYPGETFQLTAVIVGAEFGTGVGAVYAHILSKGASILESHVQKIDKPDVFNLSYTVNTTNTEVVLALTTTNREVSTSDHDDHHRRDLINVDIDRYNSNGVISTNLLTTPVFVNIELEQKCPSGFKKRVHNYCNCQEPLYGCYCDESLDKEQIQCYIENRTGYFNISQQKQMWIGKESNIVYFCNDCPFDYCDISNYPISLENDTGKQCVQNRYGKLCGKCQDNKSLAIGSNNCIECNNNNNLALLIFFSAAGFLLVFFIQILNMTVSQGTINGLLFYANIIWAYETIFFPPIDTEEPKTNFIMQFLKVFLAWLNLDFGIQTCFIKGLDAFGKTWLQFLFPLYIWMIVGAIIVLAKLSERMAWLFGENKVSVLATVILLSYAKILRTVMIILMPAKLTALPDENLNSTYQETVWAYDGNLKYLDGEHVSLFVFAILILMFLLVPYSIVLLCIQPLRSGSEFICLKWVNHAYVKPFLDAYVGPLNPQNHFWVGLLLLVRCILFVIIAVTYSNSSQACELTLVLMMTLLLLLLYYTRHIYSKPKGHKRYKCYNRHFLPTGVSFLTLLEISFFFNLLVLGAVRLYSDFGDTKDAKTEATVICVSVGIAFIQFIGIVFYHLKCKLKKSRCKHRDYQDLNTNPEVEAPPTNDQGHVPVTDVDAPSIDDDDDAYRDSILDETDSKESEEY